MRIAVNVVLLLAVIALLAANWVFHADTSRPNYEFLPQMAHSARYNAFAANPEFPSGATLQPSPAGTIARGYMPLHYDATPESATRAGVELKSPIDLSSQQARQRGATVFSNYCAVCHGPTGTGNGPVTRRGVPPPPSLLVEHALGLKDGQIFHILTFGQNNMPSYASQLSRRDRWSVIAYVRSFQASAPRPPQPQTTAAGPARTNAGGQP